MPSIIALIVTVIPILLFQESLAASQNPIFKSPGRYKQFHVHYDFNADGTYQELDEFAIIVLTEQGVQMFKEMPIGMDNSGVRSTGKRDIEILAAYTLKKDGKHVDAIRLIPQKGIGAATSGVSPTDALPQLQQEMVNFQSVDVGDTLVVSYRAIQKQPIFPNNVIVNHNFPKHVPHDDAIISFSAPTSLNLRVEVDGIENGEKTETVGIGKGASKAASNIQQVVWRYQNKNPEAMGSQPVFSFPRVHISSFRDNATEKEALNKLAAAIRSSTNTPAPPTFPSFPKKPGCKFFGLLGQVLPNDGPDAKESYKAHVELYFWKNENWLKGAADEWKKPACVFDDGSPMLASLKDGYSLVFKNQPDWSASLSRLQYLKNKFQNEPFVAIAEARYWSDYAWQARGTGFSSSVTPDGWKLFRERLEKEERILLDTKLYADALPIWYDEMIIVQSALGRPEDERDKIFLEGAQKYKTYYPIYFTMLNFLSPKWGGSWETVDNLVKWSVENTKEIDGNTMYARLYWSASQGLPKDVKLFGDTLASWPKMKSGFEDLMARHPKSKWNLNNYAKFACMAKDKKVFLALRRKIGKDVIDAAWEQKPSLDLCEVKFGYSQ